ncbi:flavodoxin [Spirochaeta africana]|uniref:Flavodoxin n=1 Tax=Spirochaeta africana (strain ATCC 700263 / DSM 8902 / Z-7692) TaxID=889378 RepID=H9UGJ7_SPIAZ|nr:flavodoxin [Spirochaeta africana]AFG36640.1 flavodoxin, long chain [Spirochaeta africana DSM 8902]
MAKIGIIFGSSTGNTETAAEKLVDALGDAEAKNITEISEDDLNGYEFLVFGASTWGAGELQDDWEDNIDVLDDADLSGKKVALFGLGDQEGYPDTFVDAMGTIAEKLKAGGATIVGHWPTDGYTFDDSTATEGGKFLGLVLDEENQADESDERIAKWAEQLKKEFA